MGKIIPFKQKDVVDSESLELPETITWEHLFFMALSDKWQINTYCLCITPEGGGKGTYHYIPYAAVENRSYIGYYAFDKETAKFYPEIEITLINDEFDSDMAQIDQAVSDILASYEKYGAPEWKSVWGAN